MISVFTAAHQTGARIAIPLLSLLNQTHQSWEWVVVDDSPGGATADEVERLANSTSAGGRVRAHRLPTSGSIGRAKAAAAALCRGDVLVELDHDDELMPNALKAIASVFDQRVDIDFVYSDWIDRASGPEEQVDDVALYPPGWAFGFGGYGLEMIGGAYVPVALAPAITWETVRHIVSMPNHVRAWRACAYRRIGGHDPSIPVGDDYELLVRTFLSCSMARIPRPLYAQHHDAAGTSASRKMNDEIQVRVAKVARDREADLDDRCHRLRLTPNTTPFPTSSGPLQASSERIDPYSDGTAEPLISLVLVASGRPDHLHEVMDGVLGQSHATLELLLVGARGSGLDELVVSADDPRVRYSEVDDVDGDLVVAGRHHARNTMTRSAVVMDLEPGRVWHRDQLADMLSGASASKLH